MERLAAMAVLGNEPRENEQQPQVEGIGHRTGGGHPERQAEGQIGPRHHAGNPAGLRLAEKRFPARLVPDQIAGAHHQPRQQGHAPGAAQGAEQSRPDGDPLRRQGREAFHQPAPHGIPRGWLGQRIQIVQQRQGRRPRKRLPTHGRQIEQKSGRKQEPAGLAVRGKLLGQGVLVQLHARIASFARRMFQVGPKKQEVVRGGGFLLADREREGIHGVLRRPGATAAGRPPGPATPANEGRRTPDLPTAAL